MRLVKAALLDADHVTLASAKAAMLTGITNFITVAGVHRNLLQTIYV
jgi:hypothetical protein